MYDTKCEELAEYFLADEPHTPEQAASLAQTIQDSIERWLDVEIHIIGRAAGAGKRKGE